jgi:hypothetical protein
MEIESLKTRVQMAETAAGVAQENAMRAMGSPGQYVSGLIPFLRDGSGAHAVTVGPIGYAVTPMGSIFGSTVPGSDSVSEPSPPTPPQSRK